MLYKLNSTPPPSPVPSGPTGVETNSSFRNLAEVLAKGAAIKVKVKFICYTSESRSSSRLPSGGSGVTEFLPPGRLS